MPCKVLLIRRAKGMFTVGFQLWESINLARKKKRIVRKGMYTLKLVIVKELLRFMLLMN